MGKNKTKIFAVLAALSLVLNLLLPASANAYTFFIPQIGSVNIDVSQVVNEGSSAAESRYGFNQDILRSANRKASAPRVEIFFDNTNPKPGEKVTAHAVPEFFKNDAQNLYYTWYLIHTQDGNIKTATNSLKDGKLEASRIMTRGDYDPDLDGQTYAEPGKDPDNDGWPSVDANSYDEDDVAAPMGGADGVGGLAENSDNLDPSLSNYCSERTKAASCNLLTNKSSFDLYYQFNGTQSDSYCATCAASSLSFGTLSFDNQCCYLIANPSDPGLVSYDPGTSYCPISYSAAYDSCFDFAALKSTNQSAIETCLSTQCETDYNATHALNFEAGQNDNDYSRCFKHNFGTSSNASGFRGYEGSTGSYGSDGSGLDYNVSCKHKWVNAPGYTSGSGKFPTGEEKYWKSDPTDPDTDGDSFVDEADIIGLGQEEFSWTYQAGDRLGVVVEGTSMIPTDESDAYYKIMWGYLDVCDSTKTGLMDSDECDDSDDYGFGYLATESPNEQGTDKLDISLSFSPDNPLADPSSENSENISSDGTISNADQITVISSLNNTDYSPSNLFYTWQISKGDPQKDDWTEIKDIPANFNSTSPPSGMGITQFNFTPKKSALASSTGINYFKVTLTASKASGQTVGRGRSSVVIPVNTQGIKISLHKVDVAAGKASVGDEICSTGLYTSLCPVVTGQMLAATVSGSHYKATDSEFSWTVDGSPVYPPANASSLFDGWSDTTIFFPITKQEKEIENISVTATSKTELLPAVGTRLATVVHPAVFVRSGDLSLSWPKVYTAENPNQKSSSMNFESSTAFEALTKSHASYYLDFVPYYLLGNDSNSSIDWSVNGTDVTSPDFYESNPYLGQISVDNDNQTIKIPISQNPGAFSTLSVNVKKYWNDDERNITSSAWGVSPDSLSGESSATIESVTSASNLDTVSSTGDTGQMLAAIGTHLPHYFMYLLRLVLTMAVMFFLSSGFYGITQNIRIFNNDEK